MLQKEREFKDLSVTPDRPLDEMFLTAPDYPNGKRGIVFGALQFPEPDDAVMHVYERVVVRGNSVHRDRYSYAFVIGGVHEYGWERHKGHPPEVHEHQGSGREKVASDPVSLKRALTLAWEMISRRAELPVDG
jgi:hypothetical protein